MSLVCPAYLLVDFGGGFLPLDYVDKLTAEELKLLDAHMQNEVLRAWKSYADSDWHRYHDNFGNYEGDGVYEPPPQWSFRICMETELRKDPEAILRIEMQLSDIGILTHPHDYLAANEDGFDERRRAERHLDWRFTAALCELYEECNRTVKHILRIRPRLSLGAAQGVAIAPHAKAERENCAEVPTASKRRCGLTRDEMNILAREYLETHARPDNRVTVRKLADYLKQLNPAGTCSTRTVCKLPAWRVYQEGLGRLEAKGQKNKPTAVSLTEGTLGVKDAELERLINEQRQDFEPSPLEPDPSDGPRWVRVRKLA